MKGLGRLVRGVLRLVVLVVVVTAVGAGWLEARSERSRDRDSRQQDRGVESMTRDYDGDGIPNSVDLWDDEWYKSDIERDYDNDGVPNAVDPYDNDWYKP